MARFTSVLLLLGTAEGASLGGQPGETFLARAGPGQGQGQGWQRHPDHAHFVAFVQEHGRAYDEGSDEYGLRFATFQERLQAVRAHNAQTDRLWSAKVNSLADWTRDELSTLRGYRHGAKPSSSSSSSSSSSPGGVGLVASLAKVHGDDVGKLPKEFTWKGRLNAMKDVQDQGACGSCWAVAASTVLRAHAELYQKDRTFSAQQIVTCAPNPQHCGGTGGCEGATAELAMDYVAKVGLVTEEEMSYEAVDGSCPTLMRVEVAAKELQSKSSSPQQKPMALPDVTVAGGGGEKFGMTGWKKLPENKVEPLMLALYEQGPVAISIAAGDDWSMYDTGIMSACSKATVINHAVVLTGYGERGSHKYWQIQNSWGSSWGEKGFLRLLRHGKEQENKYCGWDNSPEEGTACAGGPSKVWVCGSCGILYDSVVPKFSLGEGGWWSKHGGRNVTATAAAAK